MEKQKEYLIKYIYSNSDGRAAFGEIVWGLSGSNAWEEFYKKNPDIYLLDIHKI